VLVVNSRSFESCEINNDYLDNSSHSYMIFSARVEMSAY
jgi:hypothetical protein